VLIWMAAAGMVSSAVAEESSSGTSWLRTCTKAAPANAPCIGYIKAMHDMNQMLTEVFQRPLWCAQTPPLWAISGTLSCLT
jgi:hypothetical protein